jgi:hypothetical protein
MLQIVKDHPTWIRENGVLVNTDQNSYKAHLAKKNAVRSQQAIQTTALEEINILKTKVDSIESTLTEILSLLKK